jgi:hypothetical protein
MVWLKPLQNFHGRSEGSSNQGGSKLCIYSHRTAREEDFKNLGSAAHESFDQAWLPGPLKEYNVYKSRLRSKKHLIHLPALVETNDANLLFSCKKSYLLFVVVAGHNSKYTGIASPGVLQKFFDNKFVEPYLGTYLNMLFQGS